MIKNVLIILGLIILGLAVLGIKIFETIQECKKVIIKNTKKTEENIKTSENNFPYHKKYLLTKNEYYFYKKLKTVTEPLNLQILAKIRLADLVEVNKGLNQKQWGIHLNKIKSKHIDFAIADNMRIKAIIELDDSTHNRADRIERDIFVNDVLTQTGYKLIRTYGDTQPIKDFLESGREDKQGKTKENEKQADKATQSEAG